MGACGLGRDGRVVGCPPRDRSLRLLELPARAFRSREHGAGGLEHRARRGRSTTRASTASRPPGSRATSIRSSCSSRRSGSSPRAPHARCRPDRRRRARCVAGLLARPPASGLRAAGCTACARLSRLSMALVERGSMRCTRRRSRSHSSCTASTSWTATGSGCGAVRGCSHWRPVSSWGSRSRRSGSGTASRGGAGGPGSRSPLSAWDGRSRVLLRRAGVRRTARAPSSGTTPRSAALRGVLKTAVHRSWRDRVDALHREARCSTSSVSAAPLVGLFVLAPGLAAVALPQVLASGLSDSEVMTEPRHHYTAAVIPFLVAATVLGIARLPALGMRSPARSSSLRR